MTGEAQPMRSFDDPVGERGQHSDDQDLPGWVKASRAIGFGLRNDSPGNQGSDQTDRNVDYEDPSPPER
jgi:hypothetical protein